MMITIIKRTTLTAIILVSMPLAVIILGWQWDVNTIEWGWEHRILLWFSKSVSSPWRIFTGIILCFWFMLCLNCKTKNTLLLIIILISTVFINEYTKNFIKEQTQKARPYVLWLEKHYGISKKEFYENEQKNRGKILHLILANNTQLPNWLKKHWEFETGFAFPSGHTMFVASCTLLGVGILWDHRRYITITLLLLWAITVMGSRLILGMHWPLDLIIGTIISWLFATIASCLINQFCKSVDNRS